MIDCPPGRAIDREKGFTMMIIIDTMREGYAPDQIHRTMTVGELIRFLEDYDEDTPIYTGHDNRYTYGGITTDRICEVENEEDEDDE